jgi:hypothetical protein
MNQSIFNPWAPPLLNGFDDATPDGCQDVDAGYVWPETGGFQIMTANERREETLVLDRDVDFRFMALIWSTQSVDEGDTPGFLYRIKDDAGNFTSDGFIYSRATPGTLARPWPWFPHINYRSQQIIQFEIVNPAAHSQGVQLMFRGPKRFQRA